MIGWRRKGAWTMRNCLAGFAAALFVLLLSAAPAAAQQATERFIPLGQSPGISGTRTDMGVIVAADAAAGTVTFGAGAERHTVRLTPQTNIWVDRTRYGKTNLMGRFEDLVAGRALEVRYVDPATRETADWIKVVPQPGG